MYTLALFPAIPVTTTLATAGEWSSALITEFFPVFMIAIGVAVFAFAVRWVFGKLHADKD